MPRAAADNLANVADSRSAVNAPKPTEARLHRHIADLHDNVIRGGLLERCHLAITARMEELAGLRRYRDGDVYDDRKAALIAIRDLANDMAEVADFDLEALDQRPNPAMAKADHEYHLAAEAGE